MFVELPAKAEDLTYDIFMRAFINLKETDHIVNFRTWFYGIAYGMCLEYAQIDYKQNNNAYWELNEIEKNRVKVFHCNAEEQLLNLEADQLKKILKKLHPQDRLILLMRYQDSADFSTIAKQLNINESDVQVNLNRALERAVAIYHKLINSYKSNEQIKIAKSL